MQACMTRRAMLAGGGACLFGPGKARAFTGGEIDRAFDYVYPLFEMSRAIARAPRSRNTLSYRRTLTQASHRTVTTPNNDTLFAYAMLDLASGPVLVSAGDLQDRYWSIAFMDAFTDNFAILGTRATRGIGGRFLITGPFWRGRADQDVRIIRAPTHDVWMLARILVSGPDDLTAANDALSRIKVLSAPAARNLETATAGAASAEMVFDAAAEMLRRSQDAPRMHGASRHRNAGVGAVRFSQLSEPLGKAWRQALQRAVVRLGAIYPDGMPAAGAWRVSHPDIGSARASDALRAAVALGGLAALPRAEAMYFHTRHNESGGLLDPARAHEIILPTDVPVDAFWSLTMYAAESDGRFFFVDNPINRYSISNRSPGIERQPDGSIRVRIQATPPDSGNWLPAPQGPMQLAFRAYLPRAAVRRGRWVPPPIKALG
jgi:hypothetical protein